MRYFLLVILVLGFFATFARAEDAVSLLDAQKAAMGWTFDNGAEFKGATGKLSIDADAKHNGKESLRLEGDFTKGGNYVQMLRKLDASPVDPGELSFWVRDPEFTGLTMRLIDASGQCHQLNLKLQSSPDWQQIVLPVERFFANLGKSETAAVVSKYEYWGGAKDGKWHGPLAGMAIIIGPSGEKKTRVININEITVTPRSKTSSAGQIPTTLKLDETIEGESDWVFFNGSEFPGAKGSFAVVKDGLGKGKDALKLAGDFTGGGRYVAANKDLKSHEVGDISQFRMKVKTEGLKTITVRLIDATGQCHQKAGIKVTSDDEWRELVLKTSTFSGVEHWGGANDGKVHSPPSMISFVISSQDESKKSALYLADVTADAMTAAVLKPASFKADFENIVAVSAGWSVTGSASIDKKDAFKGTGALRLERAAADVDKPASVESPSFAVTPGMWEVAAAVKSELKSPDSSFNGTFDLICMDGAGKQLERIPVAELFGAKNWQSVTKRIELPKASASAKFRLQLNKAEGTFWLDDVSAAYLSAVARKDNRISRMLFATAQMGNMLFPDDKRTIDVTVEATKPLAASQLELTYDVRDYWGAEVGPVGKATLEKGPRKGQLYTYRATFDLASQPLETGRYYEVHAAIAQPDDKPFQNFTSLAILPEAITRKYKPEEIPFTSRNWDNRITEYVVLTDRIGIRLAGIWGGWQIESPYKPHAPQIELSAKLGMGVLTGTPAGAIEHHQAGYEKIDDKVLREGVRSWLSKYGKSANPIIISLGNEPHGTGDRVIENVRAYKSVYEEVKAVDPGIFVVATSVEPNEEYFKAGYYNYCDAFDFHIYEDTTAVRSSINKYKELMAKYNVKKPIWSTELGLNSQGMSRQAISAEMVRKFAVFFAAGGANVSWFDLLYPDGEAKNVGTSGESMNVFDSRYNRYHPKLDAVMYYNMVNAICIKKFVEEKQYEDGISAYLFRDKDNRTLQILWKDKGRKDVLVPLAGVDSVNVIHIDGRRTTLTATTGGVTLTVNEDPLILLYDKGGPALAEKLATPAATLVAAPAYVVRGAFASFTVAGNTGAWDEMILTAPHGWTVQQAPAPGKQGVQFTVTAPENSRIRDADMIVAVNNRKAGRVGEISLRPAVTGRLSVAVMPSPVTAGQPAGVKLTVTNRGKEKQDVTWDLALTAQRTVNEGGYGKAEPAAAYFAQTARGSIALDPETSKEITVPLAGVNPIDVYTVRAIVTDATGRSLSFERNVGGFVIVPKASGEIKMNGTLDEADWSRAPVQKLDQARQYFTFDKKIPWKGEKDLSGTVQFLWDEKCLYVGVKVTDDVFANTKSDGSIWAGDGLQFLVDPKRDSADKPGKYDYGIGVGTKGPQAWCFLSADAAAPNGEAKDILISHKRADEKTGDITYKIAIPWNRVAPFKPAIGGNLGLTMIVNEDDGAGRHGFITWFGNAHNKDIDTVGDLILSK